jgi:hypothetical protein
MSAYIQDFYIRVNHVAVLDGPMVRICRSHRQGQGSIPCLGILFAVSLYLTSIIIKWL